MEKNKEKNKKYAHTIKITVFVKEDEDKTVILNALKNFSAAKEEEFSRKKILIKQTNAEAFESQKIVILELLLEKDRHINNFLQNFVARFEKRQCETIINQAESRLDNEFAFYLRLDKPRLLENKLVLTDAGNCFHIKMSIAAFPKKRNVAINLIKELFDK